MDKGEAIKIAERYVGVINQKFPIEKAILFGSFANGNYHNDSDIDLALVFNSVEDIIDRQIELMKLRTDDDLFIEPHPFAINDFQASNPMVYEILKTGIEITNFAA
jgi:predicted nucleotidyltransferase